MYIHLLSLLPFLPLEKSFVHDNWDRRGRALFTFFFFFFLLGNWPWRTARCHVIKMVDRTGFRLIDRFIRIGSVAFRLRFDFVDKSNEFVASKICGNFSISLILLFFFKLIIHFQKIKCECIWNWMMGRTLVRSNVDLFHSLDHKESIRIILSTVYRKHLYCFFFFFLVNLCYLRKSIYIRELYIYIYLWNTKNI